jgi:hypothetical protein
VKDNRKTYLRVAIYFIVAIVLSTIFRLDYFKWYNHILLPFGLTAVVASVLAASGPIVGALIALRLTRNKPIITLYGT